MLKRDLTPADRLRIARNLLSFARDNGQPTTVLQKTVDALERAVATAHKATAADNAAFLWEAASAVKSKGDR